MEGAFEFLIRALGDGGTEERFCVPIAPFRMPQPRRLPGVEVDGDAMAM